MAGGRSAARSSPLVASENVSPRSTCVLLRHSARFRPRGRRKEGTARVSRAAASGLSRRNKVERSAISIESFHSRSSRSNTQSIICPYATLTWTSEKRSERTFFPPGWLFAALYSALFPHLCILSPSLSRALIFLLFRSIAFFLHQSSHFIHACIILYHQHLLLYHGLSQLVLLILEFDAIDSRK